MIPSAGHHLIVWSGDGHRIRLSECRPHHELRRSRRRARPGVFSMSARGGAARLLVATASVAISLLGAELVLRALPVAPPPGDLRHLHEARPDRAWIYGLRPGARVELALDDSTVEYAINAQGFRDDLYPQAKPPQTFRVLLLGDSVAFGFKTSMRATFAKQLETRLRRLGPAEVLNFGVGGYNPYNEAALLADLGERYQPDLVLVQFCINDLNDPTLHFDAQTRLALGSIPDAAFPDPARKLAAPDTSSRDACRGVRLCSLIADALGPRQDAPLDPAARRATFRPLADLRGRIEAEWIARQYGEMSREARRIGAEFAVVALPYRAQLEQPSEPGVQAQLVAIGDANGWQVFDLLPAFRRASAGDSAPLFLDLWHLSEAGHRVTADAILHELEARSWIPSPQ
jgi:lysophospholipase L1-like esterase